MNEFDKIESVAGQIKKDLDKASIKKRLGLLYAFNATGKTRLATVFTAKSEEKTLAYGAIFEDLFSWDNESNTLKLVADSKLISFISDQGLETQISDNFQKLIESKISPYFDLQNGKITFNFEPGDDRSESNIKISRGEESAFIWSIFFTILESAIHALNDEEENRETNEFNNLEYIIIDDPVSSIDDTKIITIAIELINTIELSHSNKLKFLITTHHPLFYNVLFNESHNRKYERTSWILSRNMTNFKLDVQKDTPFGYHLVVKKLIQEAISSNNLEKYHFNLFRTLLEKTATFLGYSNWSDCLTMSRKKEIMRLVNLYSHGKLSDLESKYLPEDQKILFKDAYNDFIEIFKWRH